MTTVTVNTDGGGDHLTLSAAIAALPSDLSGGGHTVNCEGSTVDATGFTMSAGSFSNASASNQIKTIGNGIYTFSAQVLASLDHHTFTTVNFVNNAIALQYRNLSAGGSVVVARCTFLNTSGFASDISGTSNAIFESCLFVDCSRGVSSDSTNTAARVNNCTIINSSSFGTVRMVVNNVYSGDAGTNDYFQPGTGSSKFASSDTSGESGLQSIAVNTTQFVDPTTDDYHLAGTGSALFHAGSTISGIGTDRDGVAYDASTPSIGCFEFIVAAGGDLLLTNRSIANYQGMRQ